MSVTIYEIRGSAIKANIIQSENRVTSYRASSAEPVTLIHDQHVQMLQDKFNLILGTNYDRAEFISALGLSDSRTESNGPGNSEEGT